jgi:hypothetical protein
LVLIERSLLSTRSLSRTRGLRACLCSSLVPVFFVAGRAGGALRDERRHFVKGERPRVA